MSTLVDVIVLHKPSHAIGICTCGATFADVQLSRSWWAEFATHLAEQVREPAKAEGLREAAADIESDWADAWGGDSMWMTTGTKVAEFVAGTLRSMAQEIEA